MATPQTLLAIIRGIRPSIRSKSDRVAIAVHAYLLARGFKLVAVGKAAEDKSDVSSDALEVGLEGWQDLDGSYAFAYLDTEGKTGSLLVHAVTMDNSIVINMLQPGSKAAPTALSIETDSLASESTDITAGFKNLGPLIMQLDSAMPGPSSKAASATREEASDRVSQAKPRFDQRPQQAQRDALREDPISGLRGMPPTGNDDLYPQGFPGSTPGFASGMADPSMGIGPGHTTEKAAGYPGGMHMGPNDPMFALGSRRGQGLPSGPFPGIRYDPTAPEGLEGFNATDFQRGMRTHPDIMPPGRGRGADFDSMFG